jgi:exodeoxyribonuclease VII small subunit
MSFEQSLTRLEAIVRELERDELDLDRALHLFEEGVATLRTAHAALAQADAQVRQLVEAADGAFATVPLDGSGA